MITIKFNETDMVLEEPLLLSDLLIKTKYKNDDFAVGVNRQFIARKFYAQSWVNDGDQVEIILPMQGG